MSRLIIAGDKIAVVTRDMEEDDEHYWDRAWCFVAAVALGGERAACWQESLKRPHRNRGATYVADAGDP